MTTLDYLVGTPLARALGLTLFHSFWEGAAVAVVLLAALCLTRASRVRYLCACLAMVAILVGFVLTIVHFMPENIGATAAMARPVSLPRASDSGGVISTHFSATDLLPWLAPLWLVGVMLFHLHGVASWMAARRLRYRGVCPAPDPWRRRLDRLRANIRLPKPITLLESSLAGVPVVVGFIRPVILVPVGMLTAMPASQIEAILLHEIAHIRRYDYLANLLQTLVEGFLFYHPAIWWISSVIRAERENCCDDFVVATSGNTHDYATALAALEHHRSIGNQVALAASGGSLMKRIRRLLYPGERSRAVLTPFLSAAVLGVGAAVALIAWQTPAPANSAPDSPWRKWVVEDVAYIITDAERTAFLALNDDAERELFSEQFWLRRDPTPSTVENEFKEEHYRRIAYANQHFIAGIPGWKTDMGRIYITFGPPDEIDAHPSGGLYTRSEAEGGGELRTFPFHLWRYRYIEHIGENVVIEFVDTARTGDYRMTMDPNTKYTIR
jgi:GWxTD domain-containing protein